MTQYSRHPHSWLPYSTPMLTLLTSPRSLPCVCLLSVALASRQMVAPRPCVWSTS